MSFDTAFDIVISAEGGYSNDPLDPGGETNFGISKRAYPSLDIKGLTLEQVKAIYFKDYWVAAGCGYIADDAMAILVFDAAVNEGVRRAKELYGLAPTPIAFQAERALHYARLSTFPHFGKGWMRRLFDGLLKSGAKI